MSWSWQPFLPTSQIAVVAIVMAALAVYAYRSTWQRHRGGTTLLLIMRLCTISGLAVLLMGPSRLPPRSRSSLPPQLTVMVDTSESMLTSDCQGKSRIGCIRGEWLHPDSLHELATDFELGLWRFGENLLPLAEESLHLDSGEIANERSTQLTNHVRKALMRMDAVVEGDALLLFSDGRDTNEESVASLASLAKSRNIPIYAVGLGGTQQKQDVALTAVPMQESLLPGEPGAIQVKLYQSGFDNSQASVRLRCNDREETFSIGFNQQAAASLQIPIHQDEPGIYTYQVSVDALPEEAETANNSQTLFCEVGERRIRVLMLEGSPFWDSKFLAQSLRKDERIEITQVSQLSDAKRETIVTRTDQTSPKVPEDLDAWSEYDIVLLGRSLQNVITEKSAQQLREFVAERGGHVVLTRGNPCDSTPEAIAIQRALEPIMPVLWTDEPLQNLSLQILAPARSGHWFSDNKMGRSMDDAFSRLPGFESMQTVVREKTATVVLAQAQPSDAALGGTQPGIVAMHYGRGSIVGMLGEGTWRWSLLPPDQEELTDVYDMFWSNLIRWLAIGADFQPGQDISLQLSRNSVRRSDSVLADISCKKKLPEGISPQVRLMGPDGSETLVAVERLPGRDTRYRTTLTFSQTGVYRARVDVPGVAAPTLEKPMSVYDINLERMLASAELKGLEQLAQESGGYFFRSDQSRDLHSTLRRHRASLLTPPRLEFVWDRLSWMTMLLSWMGLEWILRRSFDLL